MISILINAVKILFLLGFLIGIHETGHFLIAKLCKVRVNEFAIGFGPVIWKHQGKETKYAIRLIPIGGFVNMEGEEEHSDKEGSFTNASITRRIAIVAAGAIVNIIFAIILYFILMATSPTTNSSNIIANIKDGYFASESGIQPGDKILKVNNKKITTSIDVNEALNKSNGEDVTVVVLRNGEKQIYSVKPTEIKYHNTGIYLPALDSTSSKILALEPGSSGEKQGLKENDIILKINDIDTKDNPEKIVQILQENSSEKEKYKFLVERSGKEVEIEIIPDVLSNYYLGVELQIPEDTIPNRLYYGLYDTMKFIASIFENLKQLFTGNTSVAQLVGPVGISQAVSKTNGFREFLNMLALISISLGITNLLPFPPLDGGKIVFILIEAIRRKPLNQEIELKIQMLGFAFLIGLSMIVTYHDIIRLF